MAGLDQNTPFPSDITLLSQSKLLEVSFDNGKSFSFPFEFLRVFSPSAEVKGHGPGQEVLQQGKAEIDITDLQPVGNYAVRPVFSDGHDSGLYSWDYLYKLGQEQDSLWQGYLERLAAAGGSRLPSEVAAPPPATKGGCGGGGCSH